MTSKFSCTFLLFGPQVSICMHACTHTVTPFMHELDFACKYVFRHNSMMHAYACCTCKLISPCTRQLCFFSHWLKNPIFRRFHFTSLMHHFSTPRTRMCSLDQCSISCLFPTPFASLHYGLLQQKASGL